MNLASLARLCLIALLLLEVLPSTQSFRRVRRKRKRQTSGGSFCSKAGEGFHSNEDDCTKFIRCVEQGLRANGDAILRRFDFDCAPGTVFDPSISVCNHPEDGDTPLGCGAKLDWEIASNWTSTTTTERPAPATARMRKKTTRRPTTAPPPEAPEPEPIHIQIPVLPAAEADVGVVRDCNCDLAGSLSRNTCDAHTGHCSCKKYVQGEQCGSCLDKYFNLEEANTDGCSPCFCFGHTSTCGSASGYNLVPVRSVFDKKAGQWTAEDEGGVPVPIDWSPPGKDVKVTATADGQRIFFVAPMSYRGEQRRSFNRHLHFTLYVDNESDFVPSSDEDGDVIIEGSGLRIVLPAFNGAGQRRHGISLPSATPQNYSFRIHPDGGWQPKLSPPQFLKLLSDLTSVKIRGTYTAKGTGFLDNVFLETARKLPGGPPVHSVEECACPAAYSGLSCEDCSVGFMRAGCGGDVLDACVPCDCGRKCPGEPSPRTCSCSEESMHTVPAPAAAATLEEPTPAKECSCNSTGSRPTEPCDTGTGECRCKENVEGASCDACKEGSFNLAEDNEAGCASCFCFGHSNNCHSAEGYNFVPVRSVFEKKIGKWTAVDGGGGLAPLKWSSTLQDVKVTAVEPGQQIYFLAPSTYLAEQRRSYNRALNFTFYVEAEAETEAAVDLDLGSDGDIILEGSGLTVALKGVLSPKTNPETYSFRIHPDAGWAPQLSEREFLLLLSNLTALKIRGIHSPLGTGYLDNVFLETARKLPGGPPVFSVEECECPPEYAGPNCELCAVGFMRAAPTCDVDPLAECVPCDCANSCAAGQTSCTC